jgi:cation diffusion facilitator CzcD-associated flavoprotein CzcO
VFDYFKGIVEEYNLGRYIKLNRCVKHAEWDEKTGKWHIRIEDTVNGTEFVDECDVFINGGGPLK